MSETFSSPVPRSDAMRPPAALDVELVGDLVCPFCYLGKRRLDAAMQFVHGPRRLGWYPYQLNPDMPVEGQAFEQYLQKRFGSKAAVQPVFDKLKAEGREVGIEFAFDKLKHIPNTLPAHQVLYLAETRGLDPMPMVEELMSAYLTRGEDIGDRDVLVELAARHGLPADQVSNIIVDEGARSTVLEQENQVRGSGIAGVPGFLMNRRLLLIGAQDVESIVAGFDRAMFGDAEGNEVRAPLH